MEGGFSIREYASRMRSINVVNCWPFDEISSEETVKSLLPPITIKKFTWWLDEVEYISSESAKISEKKKKKRPKKGETSSRNEDPDVDEYVIKVKGKMKAQKKRSIVEIFSVAPPIERVISDEEEDEDKEDGKRKKNAVMRKALRVAKKIKKKKKENFFKLKQQLQDEATGDPSSSYSKECGRDILDSAPILGRKSSLQHLDALRKSMPCEALKPIEENQHPGLPVRGILRNHDESLNPPKQLMKCILQEAVQFNDCSTRKANKRVTFSKNDEVLRLSRKPSHSTEYHELEKVCGSDLSNVDHYGGVGKDSIIVESSGSDDASIGIEKEVEHLITCIVNSTDLSKKNNGEDPSRRPEVPNRSSPHHVNQDWPYNTMDVCAPGYFCTPLDGYDDNPNIKVIANSSNPMCRRLNKDLGAPGPNSPSPCFEDSLRPYNEHSVPHLLNMDKRKYTSLESTAMNSAHSFQFQTYPHFSPKKLMNTFCSFPEGSETGNICGRRGINGINEGLVGLPLNSQGELISLNSGAEREVNQMLYSSVRSERRSLNCIDSSMDQLNLFPIESYTKENTTDFLEVNYHSFLDSENIMFKGANQVHKSHENEKIQSTMRLMGKEFKVGGTGVQGFEEEHIWKDKQIIDDRRFASNVTSNLVHDQNEPSLLPSGMTVNHRSESNYALPHFDYQATSIHPSVFVARKVDPVQKIYPALSPVTYTEVHNNESLFSEPFASGYESPFFTLELPTPRGAHEEAFPNINPSAAAIRFPFMHPDLDGRAVSSWSRRSSVNQGPLVFDVPRKATQLSNSQSYSSLGRNHPYIKPGGSSYGTDCSMSLKRDDSRMFFPFSPGSSSEMCEAPVPYYPGILMQKRHGHPKKFKERIKKRIASRVLDNGKKSKGQLSALSTVPFKPFKMHTSGSHDNIQCAIRQPANKSKSVMYCEDEDERIISPWVDSYIDTARTGPVKLTGGAKHILKACQQKDQCCSRPTNQEALFVQPLSDFRNLKVQRRSTTSGYIFS